MLIKRRVGLTLGLGRSLMHGVAPHMCGRVASPLLGRGAGGRSPATLCRLGWRAGRKCFFRAFAIPQVRLTTLVRHVCPETVRGYEVFDEGTLFALLATAQRVLAKS